MAPAEALPPIALRPLAETDLARLARWLAEPHLRPFYVHDTPPSPDEVIRHYAPRCRPGHPVRSLIACTDQGPIGHVKWYLNSMDPTYAATIGRAGSPGASIDYFIGEPAALGQGLGQAMLRAVTADMAARLPEGERIAHIGHDVANLRAIRCTLGAGFCETGAYAERGRPCRLFELAV